MNWSGQRVLVTGGAGFIGSHLVEALIERGAGVTVIDNLSTGRRENLAAVAPSVTVWLESVVAFNWNACLPDAPFDVIFHLAGLADIPRSIDQPWDDFTINGLATLRLLEALRQSSSSARLLLASSAAVYGEALDRPLREDDPVRPTAPYGVSKLLAERYLDVYARLYGLRAATLRLFPVYGPRLRGHVIYDFVQRLAQRPEELVMQGDGGQEREFLFVSDAVAAFLHVAECAPLNGEAYNVSSGEPVTIRGLAEQIAAAMQLEPRITAGVLPKTGVSRRWVADGARLASLGFAPRVSLTQGLEQTVSWCRAGPTGATP